MSDKEKILKMVADGKISVEDAEKLLKAINEARSTERQSNHLVKFAEKIKGSSPFSGKIIIDIQSSKGENVKIKLPLKLANLALKMIPKDKITEFDQDGVNLREILTNISTMVDEVDDDILNITSASGDSVRIYVEKT
ncbi:hypothetical protein KJ966_06750 [bacterium]|nr:hypothetical protein [bacterium]